MIIGKEDSEYIGRNFATPSDMQKQDADFGEQ